MSKTRALWLRVGVVALVIAGTAFAWKQYTNRQHEIADVPTATARQGEFAVIIRCRGSLTARRSEQLTAPAGQPNASSNRSRLVGRHGASQRPRGPQK